MSTGIRPATDDDLKWLDNNVDPEELQQMEDEEIEATLASTPTPPGWRFTADSEAP